MPIFYFFVKNVVKISINKFKKYVLNYIFEFNADISLDGYLQENLRRNQLMIIPIAEYPFDGPHRTTNKIENKPGVFVVISEFVGKFYLIDVDYSDNVRDTILNHVRRRCWENYRKGKLRYALLYDQDFPGETKSEKVNKIRRRYRDIPCRSEIKI